MTGKEFTEWMKARKLRVANVAVETGLDPNTVYSFRRDEDVNESTKKMILEFVRRFDSQKTEGKVAVG